jgi:hypothetical protein
MLVLCLTLLISLTVKLVGKRSFGDIGLGVWD